MTAVKYDKGKPLPDLVLGDFMLALQHTVFVGTFGAHKYEPRNFQGLEDGEERYAEASGRHYMKRKARRELFDDESGEFHLAHEIWDKIAELYFFLKNTEGAVYEAAIWTQTPGGRLYYDYEGDWTEEECWFGEEEARQFIWRLQAEGVPVKVWKREVEKKAVSSAEMTFRESLGLEPCGGPEVYADNYKAAMKILAPAPDDLAEVRYGIRQRATGHWLAGVENWPDGYEETRWDRVPERGLEFYGRGEANDYRENLSHGTRKTTHVDKKP